MNVEIGAEAALFPEKEYINGIAVAVQVRNMTVLSYELKRLCHIPFNWDFRITWQGWRLLFRELTMLEAESRQAEVEQNSKGPVYRRWDTEKYIIKRIVEWDWEEVNTTIKTDFIPKNLAHFSVWRLPDFFFYITRTLLAPFCSKVQ